MKYPFYKQLQDVSRDMQWGNFGLWYNKLIPISNFSDCKASDEKGDEKSAVAFYFEKYNKTRKKEIDIRLAEKHREQDAFCKAFESGYEPVVFRARLKAPLITGIGESHPHEISLIFEHNLGIPYIPASGMKGIVRFSHTLGLLFDEDGHFTMKLVEQENGKEVIKEDNEQTFIPQLFGTQEKRGKAIFLDAYPEKMPDLHVDIMNPHYGDYYNGDKPPADYLDPNPIKFLTVAKNTVFVFRALADKSDICLAEMIKTAFKKALTEEGVGAKTAVGYGIFSIQDLATQSAQEKSDIEKGATSPVIKAPEPETWEKVHLTFAPNTQIISAKHEGKNASTKDNAIIPETIMKKLNKKKSASVAGLKAKLIGGKEYQIIEVIL